MKKSLLPHAPTPQNFYFWCNLFGGSPDLQAEGARSCAYRQSAVGRIAELMTAKGQKSCFTGRALW